MVRTDQICTEVLMDSFVLSHKNEIVCTQSQSFKSKIQPDYPLSKKKQHFTLPYYHPWNKTTLRESLRLYVEFEFVLVEFVVVVDIPDIDVRQCQTLVDRLVW